MNNTYNSNSILDFVDQILNKNMSEITNKPFINTKPNVNIIELDTKFEIQLAAPGVNKEDFHIDIKDDKLSISIDLQDEHTKLKYKRQEFNFSKFKRSFSLPKQIDKNEIDASYVDGILTISLIKKKKEKTENIIIDVK